MCSSLLHALRRQSSDDIGVSNLDVALRVARIIPHGQQFYTAFLGEQGIGKSSLINIIFNRDLVNVSTSSSTCTAYPTIITHKVGASDDTTESDVRGQYLNEEEIRDCVEEQGRRYRAAFSRKVREQTDEVGDTPFDVGAEEDVSDDEDDQDATPHVSSNNIVLHRRTIRPSDLRGAKTARSFFEIIFGTANDEEREIALDEDLEYTDLEDESFIDACVKAAKQRLEETSGPDGFSQLDVISYEDMGEFQEVTIEVWPLVKSVHIATGHLLLMNNVCILDLPSRTSDAVYADALTTVQVTETITMSVQH